MEKNESKSQKVNILKKSKYSFFNILSYAFTRAEARLLLSSLSKRGNELCLDPYLDLLVPLVFPIEIRSANQIPVLSRFINRYQFDDEMRIEIYLDFKREPIKILSHMIGLINQCKMARILELAGTPNNRFTDELFKMLASNKYIKEFHLDIEFIHTQGYKFLMEALAKNTNLNTINLKSCSFTNTDMEYFVQGLGLNPVKGIRSLSFNSCQIDQQGLRALFSYLQCVNPI